jgi:hypothetical protein
MSTHPFQVEELIATLNTTNIGTEALELAKLQVRSPLPSPLTNISLAVTGTASAGVAGISTGSSLPYFPSPVRMCLYHGGSDQYTHSTNPVRSILVYGSEPCAQTPQQQCS